MQLFSSFFLFFVFANISINNYTTALQLAPTPFAPFSAQVNLAGVVAKINATTTSATARVKQKYIDYKIILLMHATVGYFARLYNNSALGASDSLREARA